MRSLFLVLAAFAVVAIGGLSAVAHATAAPAKHEVRSAAELRHVLNVLKRRNAGGQPAAVTCSPADDCDEARFLAECKAVGGVGSSAGDRLVCSLPAKR